MKVALLEIWKQGGTAQYAAGLADGLSDAKTAQSEVHLIVPADFGCQTTSCRLHRSLSELKGARAGGKLASAIVLSWRRRRIAVQTCRILDEIKPQVVHVLGTSAASRKLLSHARRLGARSVVTVHDLPRRSERKLLFFNLWSRHFIEADQIIVHGRWSRAQIEATYGTQVAARTVVMPLGLYDYGKPSASRAVLRERYGLPADEVVVLFFGSLRRNKGLEVLIEALALETSKRVHVLVAGQHPSQSEPPVAWYQKLAAERGVESRITWRIGYVADPEVADLFSCVDIVAIPYLKSFAGQSSVLSVAAAYSVPVIASDVGDIGPVVREYGLGFCVEGDSPAALAQLLGEAGGGSIVWNERRSQEFARDSGWTNIGHQLWNLYRDLCHETDNGLVEKTLGDASVA